MVLPAMSVSKVDIAAALGVSRQTLYDILAEKQPVTPAMAVRLGAVFETSAASWLRMQTAYDLLARRARSRHLQAAPAAEGQLTGGARPHAHPAGACGPAAAARAFSTRVTA